MNNKVISIFALFLALAASFTACKKDDPAKPATMLELTLSDDNKTATLVFSEGVYSKSDKTGALDANSFNVSMAGGTATAGSYTVAHTPGASTATFTFTHGGVANGQEVITITPKTATSIYNAAGAAMPTTESKSVNLRELGIIGRWYSSRANVAPILINLGIDSIYAEFRANNTYTVESFSGGAKTTLTGTFTQTKTTSNDIWGIVVNQSQPTSLKSQGIFKVFAGTPITMKYEIAQTEPQIPGVTPPTAAGGFGSTSGGAFGNLNIQTYIKMN